MCKDFCPSCMEEKINMGGMHPDAGMPERGVFYKITENFCIRMHVFAYMINLRMPTK